MKLSFGNSKLAKRFAWLFIICAFVPTLFLVFVAYDKVSSQLLEQSVVKLVKETKTYGLSLFDRLIRMSDQLLFISRIVEREGIGSGRIAEVTTPETFEIFDGLGLITESGQEIALLGEPELAGIADNVTFADGNYEAVSIITKRSGDSPVSVYLLYRVELEAGMKTFIVGKANVSRLWGIGVVPLLPPSTELAVYDSQGEILIGTSASPGTSFNPDFQSSSAKNLKTFTYGHQGSRYIAGLWGLFLQSRFDSGTWLIVLSQPKHYILSALADFKRDLILGVMLGLWVIMLMSLFFIRRGLAPLDLLKKRTELIAKRDFTSEIKVESGDEFEVLADSFNDMSRQLQKQFSALATIDRIDRAILSSINLSDIIDTSLPMLRNFFACDLLLLGRILQTSDSFLKSYVLEAGFAGPEEKYLSFEPGSRDLLFEDSEVRSWTDFTSRPLFFNNFSLGRFGTIVTIPLTKSGQEKGLLLLAYEVAREFDDTEKSQVRQLADQLSIAMANAELVENLEKLAGGTIEALARTVDAKSKWTSGHSERVSVLAGRIGEGLGLDEERIDTLFRGGLLHDIGKIAIPLAILDKPSRLSEEEYNEIMSHPEIGAKILEPIEAYQDILPMIAQHHERYDGKGYPKGLKGEEICLEGRILAVADVYDALTSSRPYRDGWVKEKATDYLTKQSGTLFDPKVVAVFMALIE